jgi:integrase
MSDNIIPVDTLGLSWSVHARKRGTVQIRLRLEGKPFSISTGVKNPSDLSRSQQVTIIRDWLAKKPKTKSGTIDSEITRFIRLRYEGRAPKTTEDAERFLRRMVEVLGLRRVTDLSKDRCEVGKVALRATWKAKTWANGLSIMRSFARWEVGEGNLKEDPFVNFRFPSKSEFGRREAVWEPERYEAVREILTGDDREIFTVMYETGMDSSDVYQLRPEHLVEVKAKGKRFWKLHKLRAKAKSSREIISQPLSKVAAKILVGREPWDLSRYLTAQSFAANLLKRVHKAQVKLGFKDRLSIKHLRHTFATRHAQRFLEGEGGPPMGVLRSWLGHAKDSRTLERLYIHAETSDLYMT